MITINIIIIIVMLYYAKGSQIINIYCQCEIALGLRPSFYRRKPLLQQRYLLSFRLR